MWQILDKQKEKGDHIESYINSNLMHCENQSKQSNATMNMYCVFVVCMGSFFIIYKRCDKLINLGRQDTFNVSSLNAQERKPWLDQSYHWNAYV